MTATGHVIAAELVAAVGEVLVAVGDEVGPTDTLVVLESMKMEIPVLAEVRGVISELAVSIGDSIREGDTIAVIEPVALTPAQPRPSLPSKELP